MTTTGRTPHEHRAELLESALAALAVALLCSLLTDTLAGLDSLRFARKVTWDWLVGRMHGDAGDVVVVDISSVKRPANAAGQPVTDRAQLEEVLEVLRVAGPRAIGLDIDMSPERGAPVDKTDPGLLARLAAFKCNGTSIPVRVGVHRAHAEERAAWLGREDLASLAATLVADTSDNRFMPLSVAWPGGSELRALGAGTAMAGSGGPYPPPPRWSVGLASPFSDHAPAGLVMQSFLVDFSTVSDLLDRRLPSEARGAELPIDGLVEALKADLAKKPSPVEGKVVFVGFGDPSSMVDNGFVPPGMLRPVPGVYAHAAAAATLLGDGYLYEPSPLLEKLIDVGLTLLLIAIVTVVRWKLLRRMSEADELALHVLLTAGAVLATWLLIGPVFVSLFRIVPDGLPIVTLVLLVEVLWSPLVVLFRAVRTAVTRAPA